MTTSSPIHEITPIPDKTFPMNTFRCQNFEPHWHDHLEWVVILRGASRFQVDGDFVDMQKGELMFVNSKQVHSATPLTDDTEMIAVVFNDVLLRNAGLDCTDNRYFGSLLSNRLQLPNFIKMDEPLCPDIRHSLLAIIDEFEHHRTGFELFIKSEFYRLFGVIFRNYPPAGEARRQSHETTQFTSLLTFLREHFAETIQLREAARMVNMSPNYFCHIFKKLTGKTLVEYLHILRVMKAEQLLLETDLPITTIACEVGFSNVTYFGRIFKKYKNRMPSDLRRQEVDVPTTHVM
ncbi:AraC family transcriptional regulator [Alicyclobacillus fastidiosus]|uniref:AraC family transcriptional regulator n=1 Tax=Alicyclobacillus fastidiosus TaxID=392011 RepID=A0ABY6ZAG6_9BACL|nr:AraC family transcriptional regulator [Alicyclobacillus fastidiosus]WAH39819.1 AraC family transcriptional regulator [Alicyclobacillus fastidiosus]GMA61076.1 hypothetical protein GCM10025859_15160 [Alicyclobacillus fastidiosus]